MWRASSKSDLQIRNELNERRQRCFDHHHSRDDNLKNWKTAGKKFEGVKRKSFFITISERLGAL